MGDDWDPFADPAETAPAGGEAEPGGDAAAGGAPSRSLDRELLEDFRAGRLAPLVEEYHKLLRAMPNGPTCSEEEGAPRASGAPLAYGPRYVPVDSSDGRPRLVIYGDSITHGSPVSLSAPFCAAVAQRNAEAVSVENAGWGGLMALMMPSPGSFPTSFGPLPLPRAEDFQCEYLCILIGTNDAMSMCAPEAWTDLFKTTKSLEQPGQGGPPKLPEDWRTSCPPSPELFERSLRDFVSSVRATSGAHVAIATPPVLGEELEDKCVDRRMRRSTAAALDDLAAAARRVARDQDCEVLPLLECMRARLGELQAAGRPARPWTPGNFGKLMTETMGDPRVRQVPLEDLGEESTRPALCYDLVHFNEAGAAIFSALIQRWLDKQLEG